MQICKPRLFLTVALLAGGCAAPSGYYAAQHHFDAGLIAEHRGDYAQARHHFEAALEQAEIGGLPQDYMSAVTYNLGRMVGYTCDFEEADRLLREALRLEQALRYPDQGMVAKRLSELARLSYDSGRVEDSVNYYERAIPILEQLGIARIDPIGYAMFLDDYALAMEAAGNAADRVREKAAFLRDLNPGKQAEFAPVHYRSVCNE
jgi:tetratricopeptide (TPR) repeat protein